MTPRAGDEGEGDGDGDGDRDVEPDGDWDWDDRVDGSAMVTVLKFNSSMQMVANGNDYGYCRANVDADDAYGKLTRVVLMGGSDGWF